MAGIDGAGASGAAEEIVQLIAAARAERDQHRRAGRQIEALAGNIRIAALQDALAVVKRRGS